MQIKSRQLKTWSPAPNVQQQPDAMPSPCGAALSKVFFEEKFNSLDVWVQSTTKGVEACKFKLSTGKIYGDAMLDQGMQTSQDTRFYCRSAEFKSFPNEQKPTIQFTVKHEQNIDCG